MSAPTLFPYQVAAVRAFHDRIAAGYRAPLLVSPTGGGKTVVAADIVRSMPDGEKRTLVLVHRRELVTQTSAKLQDVGLPHGIIQAGTPPSPIYDVQVASIQTLHARAVRRDIMPLPPADLVWVDEAHHVVARTYSEIVAAYPDAILLGSTATPCRGDGSGLGGIFDTIIETPQVADLIKLGRLVPTRVYAPIDPDLKGVHTVAGDYNEGQLAERMDRAELVGDIVAHWHKFGQRRKTVVFAVNVAHSLHVRDEFVRSGVRAEHIDGSTPKDVRDAILARLASGETDLVSNCQVLTEGWDAPTVGCIMLARPTKKMGLFRQMVGRGLRTADGKTDLILLDHSGAVYRHGFPEDEVAWTLDPDAKPVNRTERNRGNGNGSDGPTILECSRCSALRISGRACEHCGFLPQRRPEGVEIADGELGEVRQRRAVPTVYGPEERIRWHRMLVWIGRENGYKPTWAAVNFKEKFGAWPPTPRYAVVEPLQPSPEVRSWVRSRLIAFAKRRSA
jgi:DNA repair protein RadD